MGLFSLFWDAVVLAWFTLRDEIRKLVTGSYT